MASQFVYLNTNNRIQGTHATPTFSVDIPQTVGEPFLSVYSVSLNYTVYPISIAKGNYVLSWVEENGGTFNGTTQITVDQLYTPDELGAEIETIMSAASPSGITFTYSYSSATGKITLTADVGEFMFVNGGNSAWNVVGYDFVTQSTSGVMVMPYPVNLSGTQWINITSNLSIGRNVTGDSTVAPLVQIPTNNTMFGEHIHYQSQIQQTLPFHENNHITFMFLDDTNRIIEFAGNNPISICLELHQS